MNDIWMLSAVLVVWAIVLTLLYIIYTKYKKSKKSDIYTNVRKLDYQVDGIIPNQKEIRLGVSVNDGVSKGNIVVTIPVDVLINGEFDLKDILKGVTNIEEMNTNNITLTPSQSSKSRSNESTENLEQLDPDITIELTEEEMEDEYSPAGDQELNDSQLTEDDLLIDLND